MKNTYIRIYNDYIIKLDAISAYRMYNNKLNVLLDGNWISFDGEYTYLKEVYESLCKKLTIVSLDGESI